MDETTINVEGVCKKFTASARWSMLYGITDLAKDFLGIKSRSDNLRKSEFWAIKDVSFSVSRGQCVGLIGPNGAGKSTLLRLVSGIIRNDTGRVVTEGRIGSLISVGAGFHPLLTGRENIYIQGAIQGMRKREIDEKLDEIIEFADVNEFIDSPIKYYSSGMFVRLGFSIATTIKPDILLIDEILAVGDKMFQVKCFNRINELKRDCAILFVSHNMSAIARICDSVIVSDRGKIIYHGSTNEAIEVYNGLFSTNLKGFVEVSDGFSYESSSLDKSEIKWGDDLEISIQFKSTVSYDKCKARIVFMDSNGMPTAEWISTNRNIFYNLVPGRNKISVKLSNIKLKTDKYYISFIVSPIDSEKYLICAHACESVKVQDSLHGYTAYQL